MRVETEGPQRRLGAGPRAEIPATAPPPGSERRVEADPPCRYATRTYRWSARYAFEKSPSLKRRNWTFHSPAALIRKV